MNNTANLDKTVKDIVHTFADNMITARIIFEDNSQTYIFIQRGMIFVADCDYAELSQRMDADDIDSYECYDTTDGCAYYLSSQFADYIAEAYIWFFDNCARLLS